MYFFLAFHDLFPKIVQDFIQVLISQKAYLYQLILVLAKYLQDVLLCPVFLIFGHIGKHPLKFIDADELMLSMQFVDASQTAQSLGIAVLAETDHQDLPIFMRVSFLAIDFGNLLHLDNLIKGKITYINLSITKINLCYRLSALYFDMGI
jgi:hypothetical protein